MALKYEKKTYYRDDARIAKEIHPCHEAEGRKEGRISFYADPNSENHFSCFSMSAAETLG